VKWILIQEINMRINVYTKRFKINKTARKKLILNVNTDYIAY